MVGARRAARTDFLDSSLIERLYENATREHERVKAEALAGYEESEQEVQLLAAPHATLTRSLTAGHRSCISGTRPFGRRALADIT